MVRGSHRRILLPAAGFAVLLGLSLFSVELSDGKPERELYLAARQYLDALRAGDLEVVLARLDGVPVAQDARSAAQRQAWLGHVTRLEVAPNGRGGETIVAWSHPQRGRGREERILWIRDGSGAWRVHRSDPLPIGSPRRS